MNIEHKRHSLAHLLAAAVLELYPDTLNTIGPAIDTGFYYDFEFTTPITEADLPRIEKKMKELLPHWEGMTRTEVDEKTARALFTKNPYKLELIDEIISKKEPITLYKIGSDKHTFTDLCRGGHTDSVKKDIVTDSWKLERIAGAYWRGNEQNKMLTRIYGLAFDTKAELETYITQQEEAKKRDHRKIGKEMKLFTLSPLIGSGLPLMQPRGMIIRKAIEDYLWSLHKTEGYDRVWTPHIAKEDLYITSGHAAKFGDELFRVSGKEEKFFLKPMNCPHHMQIFADNQFSYRDLPVRYFEPATVYRDEKTGQLAGLTRVRAITQDDGHLFCRDTQIGQEVSTIVTIIKTFYESIGMMSDYWVRLSTRGDDKSLYLGSDDIWNKAETALEQAAKDNKLNYKHGKGEAAFYGPKLDFMFKDSIGREWQLATIQCDFNLPERFNLSFTNEKGEKERPVVIHRAISGSLERFMGILIEHFAGNFPLWLSPVQVAIIPVSENHNEKALELSSALKKADIRVDTLLYKDGLGKKIRHVKVDKIPYWIVVGDKEVADHSFTLEHRSGSKIERMAHETLINHLNEEITSRKIV